jgi:hypothetical protein
VPADPLAHQHGQLPVPAGQHRVQVGAGRATGPGHDQRTERSFELAARSRQQRVGVVAGYPERVGEFVVLELGDQAQLDDITFARVQPVDRRPDQLLDLDTLGLRADLGGLGGNVRGLLERGQGAPGAQPAHAFVPGDRVEPGAQLGRIAQVPQLGRGDQKRVLHRVGGIGRLAEHGTAVRVERHGIPVVRFGEPGGVASHDGGDNLRVFHRQYRSSATHSGQSECDITIGGNGQQVGIGGLTTW